MAYSDSLMAGRGRGRGDDRESVFEEKAQPIKKCLGRARVLNKIDGLGGEELLAPSPGLVIDRPESHTAPLAKRNADMFNKANPGYAGSGKREGPPKTLEADPPTQCAEEKVETWLTKTTQRKAAPVPKEKESRRVIVAPSYGNGWEKVDSIYLNQLEGLSNLEVTEFWE